MGETGVTKTAAPNLHIVWSVFAAEGFSTSSRIFYYVVRDLNASTWMRAPPFMRFIQDHLWTAVSEAKAVAIEAALARGEVCPHGDQVFRATVGSPLRDDHIYGFYTMPSIGRGCARGAASVLSGRRISTSSVIGASEGGRQSAAGSLSVAPAVEDLAVALDLPLK